MNPHIVESVPHLGVFIQPRPIALGRKNYLFMGSIGGGKAAAIAYTLMETCKMNNVDPEAERVNDFETTGF